MRIYTDFLTPFFSSIKEFPCNLNFISHLPPFSFSIPFPSLSFQNCNFLSFWFKRIFCDFFSPSNQMTLRKKSQINYRTTQEEENALKGNSILLLEYCHQIARKKEERKKKVETVNELFWRFKRSRDIEKGIGN